MNKKLRKWLSDTFPNIGDLIKIQKFDIGQSNPTFLIECEKKIFVLRTTPKGSLLKGAHRIDREFKVMSALKHTKIPVPKVLIFCDSKQIIGTEFFVMEFVDGLKETNPHFIKSNEITRKKVYLQKLNLLVKLAKLDLDKIKLNEYGRFKKYIERQIYLWIKQYRASETKTIN